LDDVGERDIARCWLHAGTESERGTRQSATFGPVYGCLVALVLLHHLTLHFTSSLRDHMLAVAKPILSSFSPENHGFFSCYNRTIYITQLPVDLDVCSSLSLQTNVI